MTPQLQALATTDPFDRWLLPLALAGLAFIQLAHLCN